MPATTNDFLAAMNGTTFDAVNECAVAPGSLNYKGDIINGKFATTLAGPFKFTAESHAALSAPGATQLQSGVGFTAGGLNYAVTLQGEYITTQVTSP